MASSGHVDILQPQNYRHQHNHYHQSFDHLVGEGTARCIVRPSNMHHSLLGVLKSGLDINIDPINQRALLDYQLVQLLIDVGQFIDRLDQFVYFFISHIILFLLHVLLKFMIPHDFLLFLCQFDCCIRRWFFIGADSGEIFFLLVAQTLAGLPYFACQRCLQVL